MENMKTQEFLNTLTDEQQAAVLACKTEEELEKVFDDHDIELSDDMLEGVMGGKGFFQSLIASAIVFTSTAAIVADPSSDGTIFTQATITANAVNVENVLNETAIETGLACFGQFVPNGRAFLPVLKGALTLLGITGGGSGSTAVSTNELNQNIMDMRREINDRLNELDNNMAHNTTTILNTIKNQSYVGGLGTELDNMHTSATSIASQIDTLNNDTSITNEERAVEIAALIGNNYEWTRSGSFVFNMKKIGNSLGGGTFSDMGNRDMYQVLYDYYLNSVMFSGEAYDAADPYVDRVMYEYFYAYTVMMKCFDSAKTVSQFTQEQIDSLSEKTREKYRQSASQLSLVNNEVSTIADKVYNVERSDSVVSHFAMFKYKKENERNIFVDKGRNGSGIVIAPDLKATYIETRNSYNIRYTDESAFVIQQLNRYNSDKKLLSDTIAGSAIKGSKIK